MSFLPKGTVYRLSSLAVHLTSAITCKLGLAAAKAPAAQLKRYSQHPSPATLLRRKQPAIRVRRKSVLELGMHRSHRRYKRPLALGSSWLMIVNLLVVLMPKCSCKAWVSFFPRGRARPSFHMVERWWCATRPTISTWLTSWLDRKSVV